MTQLQALFLLIAIPLAFTVPGRVADRIFGFPRWPAPTRLAAYVTVSAIYIYLCAAILARLPEGSNLRSPLAWLAFLLPLASEILYAERTGAGAQHIYLKLRRSGAQGLMLIGIPAIFYCLSAYTFLTKASLGTLFVFNLGDFPEYAVLAKRLAAGLGFTVNYFVADFWAGPVLGRWDISLPTCARLPFMPYVGSYFTILAGSESAALYNMNFAGMFFASLVPVAIYGTMSLWLDLKGILTPGRKIILASVAAAVPFMPVQTAYFALGSIAGVTTFMFFAIFIFALTRPVPAGLVFLAGLVMMLSRPEAIFLGLIYLTTLVPAAVYKRFAPETQTAARGNHAIAFVAVAMAILAYWTCFKPVCGGASPPTLNIYFYKWSEPLGIFENMFRSGSDINPAIEKQNLAQNPDISHLINLSIFDEILRHPMEFTFFFGEEVLRRTADMFYAYFIFSEPLIEFLLNHGIGAAAVVIWVLLCLYFRTTYAVWFVLVYISFIAASNAGATMRHLVAVASLTIVAPFTAFVAWRDERWTLNYAKVFLIGALIWITISFGVVFPKLGEMARVRTTESAADWIAQRARKTDFVLAQYPQLISARTGLGALGGSRFPLAINEYFQRFRPEWIMFDYARPELPLTYNFVKLLAGNRPEELLNGYDLVLNSSEKRVLVYHLRGAPMREGAEKLSP